MSRPEGLSMNAPATGAVFYGISGTNYTADANSRAVVNFKDFMDALAAGWTVPGVPVAGAVYLGPWASRPAANSVSVGATIVVTDIPAGGRSTWYSDGTNWRPTAPIPILRTGIPFIVTSSGTMGNNGAVSAITALRKAYPNAYFYFEAAQIAAGSAAGWYFGQMGSTTTVTLFNNPYIAGTPAIPASPTAFVTTGPGAFTRAVATQFTGPSGVVPDNTLGINGALEFRGVQQVPNNANAKTLYRYFGGSNTGSSANTSIAQAGFISTLWENGLTNSQSTLNGNFGDPASGGQMNDTAIDTTAAQFAQARFQLAVATDYLVLESFGITLLPN